MRLSERKSECSFCRKRVKEGATYGNVIICHRCATELLPKLIGASLIDAEIEPRFADDQQHVLTYTENRAEDIKQKILDSIYSLEWDKDGNN